MSSIDPGVSNMLDQLVRGKGGYMLDAPVSGGEAGAIAAELAIMVGGPLAIFNRTYTVFKALGKSITHVGEQVGAGNTVKLINQIMVAIHIGAMSEALAFGKKAGVHPEVAYEAIKHGLAGSKVLDMKLSNVKKRRLCSRLSGGVASKGFEQCIKKGGRDECLAAT